MLPEVTLDKTEYVPGDVMRLTVKYYGAVDDGLLEASFWINYPGSTIREVQAHATVGPLITVEDSDGRVWQPVSSTSTEQIWEAVA